MLALVWLLVGAGVGGGYQALHPLGQRRATSVARGAAGGFVGGFVYVAWVDNFSLASWLGAFFVATVAVCVVGTVKAIATRIDAYQKSQDAPAPRL